MRDWSEATEPGGLHARYAKRLCEQNVCIGFKFHTQLAKISFDDFFHLTGEVSFDFSAGMKYEGYRRYLKGTYLFVFNQYVCGRPRHEITRKIIATTSAKKS